MYNCILLEERSKVSNIYVQGKEMGKKIKKHMQMVMTNIEKKEYLQLSSIFQLKRGFMSAENSINGDRS